MLIVSTYIFFVLFIIVGSMVEITAILAPSQLLDLKEKMKIWTKNTKEGVKNELPSGYGLHFMYSFLTIVGILSSQWLLFLVLLIMGLIPKKYKIQIIIDGLMSLILIVTIVINRFHLHYNVTALFLSFFK